jgi:hypothetical protein
VVCRRWWRLATNPKFIARFHAYYRKPPLLGFFQHREQDIVFTPILDHPDRVPPMQGPTMGSKRETRREAGRFGTFHVQK